MLSQKGIWIYKACGLIIDAQDGKKRGLRDFDVADGAHPLLPLLLFFEKFLLPRHVAAIALGEDVLPQRFDRRTGDDAGADRGLDGDFEQVTRNLLFQLLNDRPTAPVGIVLVHDGAQGVDFLPI